MESIQSWDHMENPLCSHVTNEKTLEPHFGLQTSLCILVLYRSVFFNVSAYEEFYTVLEKLISAALVVTGHWSRYNQI